MTRNITLSVEDSVLKEVRRIAVEQDYRKWPRPAIFARTRRRKEKKRKSASRPAQIAPQNEGESRPHRLDSREAPCPSSAILTTTFFSKSRWGELLCCAILHFRQCRDHFSQVLLGAFHEKIDSFRGANRAGQRDSPFDGMPMPLSNAALVPSAGEKSVDVP
jgi:hypothetical protein